MTKKILRIIALMLTLVCVLTACGHTHSYGEWEISEEATCEKEGILMQKCSCGDYLTKTTPKIAEHTFSNGNCTICNFSVVTAVGDIIKESPDQYKLGSYIKAFSCSDFSPKEDSYNYILGFAYDESTKTLLMQLSRSRESDNITVTINNGVISSRYDYMYSFTNPYGGYTDEIEGVFTATSLSSTDTFTCSDFSAGSGSAIAYFIDRYIEDAAVCTKLLVEYLNDFLSYNELGFTAEAFNFK